MGIAETLSTNEGALRGLAATEGSPNADMTSSPLTPRRRGGLISNHALHELERDPECKSYAIVQELASPDLRLGRNIDKPKADTILAVFA